MNALNFFSRVFLNVILIMTQAFPWTIRNEVSANRHLQSFAYQCSDPSVNLVSWWPGQNSAEDMYGKNNGTIMKGATFAPGVVGKAFQLDGDDDYIAVPDSDGLNPPDTITISLWAKRNSLNYSGLVVKKGSDDNSGYSIESDHDNISFWVNIKDQGWVSSPLATLPLIDQWIHIAGVYDGSKISLFLDGNLYGVPTPTAGGIVINNSPLALGNDLANPGRNFGGLIDEVQIYNRALSPTEILAIYSSGSAGQCGIYSRKEVDKNLAPNRSRINYKITLDNESSANFDSVVLTDAIPIPLTYIDGSLSATSGDARQDAGVISWSGTVVSGQIIYITFGAWIPQSAIIGVQVTNSATIKNGNSEVIRSAKFKVTKFLNFVPKFSLNETP